jgi:ribonuclease HII
VLIPVIDPPGRDDFPAGVDEVGRGCLAGPVVAGAVILPVYYDLPGLNDSKKLSPTLRETLTRAIKAQAVAWALGVSWPREIEERNIHEATLLAMARAVSALRVVPSGLAVDGIHRVPLPLPQECIVGGDALIPLISAASIVAKTFRDRLLTHLDRKYPGYFLAEHKGYGTPQHLQALRELGPCPMHRRTFRGVVPQRELQRWLPGI